MEITKSRAVTEQIKFKSTEVKGAHEAYTFPSQLNGEEGEPQSWYMNFNGRKEPEVKSEATTM